MRPPVRLLQPLEAQLNLHVCSNCRHNVLPAYSLNHTARRHASSGQTPFTDRLRQRIWGSDKPPGLEDPYGGEGVISKALRKSRDKLDGEQEQVVQAQVVQEQELYRDQADEQAEAAAAAAQVGRGKDSQYTGEFTPAATAEGLRVIGHQNKWTSVGPKKADKYSP